MPEPIATLLAKSSHYKNGLINTMLTIKETNFFDEENRTIHFRGINLAGSSKLPYKQASHIKESLDSESISFVNRPFSLEEADEHFARLKHWGFNLLRFVVTWEAIEHQGQGIYDEDYLEYLRLVIEKAASYGFYIFIDPHQDVWSRFCGGDGAPAWTLELAGFNLDKLAETGAATLHAIHGNPYPHMIWGTNYGKLASATMFSLFWAGSDLAPKTKYEGLSLQEILQDSYIAAFSQIAMHLSHIPQVIGYGVMNEPSPGFIGVKDLSKKAHSLLLRGPSPSVKEAMALGAGLSQKIEVWELGWRGLKLKRTDKLNADQVSAWQKENLPIWQENGVWDLIDKKLLVHKPQHFSHLHGKKIHFYRDYYIPFAKRYMKSIQAHHAKPWFFLEGIPADRDFYWPTGSVAQDTSSSTSDSFQIVHAPHWYDVATLITKRYFRFFSYDVEFNKLIFGTERIRKVFNRQMSAMKALSSERMNHAPTLIGEVGIPMDLDKKRAYTTGDYKKQVRALDRTLSILEEKLLSYCIWNYSPDNSHEHGDGWNAEDFSIFSPETLAQTVADEPISQGGRALEAFVRPYAKSVAGFVKHMQFSLKEKRFELSFETSGFSADNLVPTVIYVPKLQYPHGYRTELSDGKLVDAGEQHIHYYHSNSCLEHTVLIYPESQPGRKAL